MAIILTAFTSFSIFLKSSLERFNLLRAKSSGFASLNIIEKTKCKGMISGLGKIFYNYYYYCKAFSLGRILWFNDILTYFHNYL